MLIDSEELKKELIEYEREVTNSAVLLCEYRTLDDKVYKIKDLLGGQK